MTVEMFRAEDYANEDDEQDSTHAALFAHVGVADPADWRAVALALAARYAPDVLRTDAAPAPTRKKAGRPVKWDIMAKGILLTAIEGLQKDAREGRINRNLSTVEAACDYLLHHADASSLRDGCSMYMPVNVTVDNLKNMVSRARKERPREQVEIIDT